LYPLQLKLTQIPEYDAQIDQMVYQLINQGAYKKMVNQYENIIKTISADLATDIYRDRAIVLADISEKTVSEPFSLEQLQHVIKSDKIVLKKRFDYLSQIYQQARLSYHLEQIATDTFKLTLQIDGNNPVRLDFSQLDKGVFYQNDNGKNIVLNKDIILYPGRYLAKNTQTLFHLESWGADTIKNQPKNYQMIFKGSKQQASTLLKKITFYNFITGKKLLDSDIFASNLNNSPLSPVKTNNKKIQQIVLSGQIDVTQTKEYAANTKVIIKPGTRFIMHPNTSLYFYGQVIAKGTKQQAIQFIAKDSEQPWGIVAIQGKGANNSSFEYIEVSNGSVDSHHQIQVVRIIDN